MNVQYKIGVKEDDTLRESFNALTRKTFGFDFTGWYDAGHWGDWYIPHVMRCGDKVISNVSVNLMQFDVQGVTKNYLQLGTVMTDPEYGGRGVNRWIMEQILEEYAGKVDGIYLFGNDEVVNYYPRFGFKPAKEYEYFLQLDDQAAVIPYRIEAVDLNREEQAERLYTLIRAYSIDSSALNQNDGLYMSENISLYQFWLAAGYGEQLYYLPETGNYVIAEADEAVLRLRQIFGKQQVDIACLAAAFGETISEVALGYTPANKGGFSVREHKEEDCTLFILGEDLRRIEQEKLMFPVLSHA